MTSITTDRQQRNASNLWLPIGSVVIVIGVIGGAAVTWATDRAELHLGTSRNIQQDARLDIHQAAIDQLKLDQATRSARDEDLRRRIDELQASINRVAEILRSKP